MSALASGSRDIASSITKVAHIARSTNAAAAHTATAAEEMVRVAAELDLLVGERVAA